MRRGIPRRNLWIGAHALAAGAIVLVACSSGEPSGDAANAGTLSTVADTVTGPSSVVTAAPSSTDSSEPLAIQGISFSSEVMPTLEASCAPSPPTVTSCPASSPSPSVIRLRVAAGRFDGLPPLPQ